MKKKGGEDPILFHNIVLPLLGLVYLSRYKVVKVDSEKREVILSDPPTTVTYRQMIDRSGYDLIKLRRDNIVYDYTPDIKYKSVMTVLIIKQNFSYLLAFNIGGMNLKFSKIKVTKYLINDEGNETVVGEYTGNLYGDYQSCKYDIYRWRVMKLKDQDGKKVIFSKINR